MLMNASSSKCGHHSWWWCSIRRSIICGCPSTFVSASQCVDPAAAPRLLCIGFPHEAHTQRVLQLHPPPEHAAVRLESVHVAPLALDSPEDQSAILVPGRAADVAARATDAAVGDLLPLHAERPELDLLARPAHQRVHDIALQSCFLQAHVAVRVEADGVEARYLFWIHASCDHFSVMRRLAWEAKWSSSLEKKVDKVAEASVSS